MQRQMTSLEEKEIRGLSLKNLLYFIGTIVSLVGVYFTLRGDIRELKKEREGDDRYNELRLKTMELNISSLQVQINDLRNQVIENTKNIDKK